MRYQILLLSLVVLLLSACANTPPAAQTAAATAEAAPTLAISTEEGIRTFVVVSEESEASYIAEEQLFQGALDKYNLPIGLATVRGSTKQIEGTLQLDLATAELGPTRFTVDLVSLVTGQNDRDGWIRGNALESNRYPLAVFEPTEIQNAPTNYQEGQEANFQLVGDMTIRDITAPMTFDVTATLQGGEIRGFAEANSQMTDWGFDPPSFLGTLTVANDFIIRVDFVARAQ
ncbi:MAG: YceI family protein [Caldilineaceae bacterium]|nr:YceI family protein [Caldilineaceae bacterium]